MAWPKLEYVHCYGFDRELLPIIVRACDGGMVTWIESTVILSSAEGVFEWAGCVWQMKEFSEWVHSVTLLEGTIESESLTAALLKGKIETS